LKESRRAMRDLDDHVRRLLTLDGRDPSHAEMRADHTTHLVALEEAAIALMQVQKGPGEPRREEAHVAVEAYLRTVRRLATPAAPRSLPDDDDAPRCEGCGAPATHVTADDVDLCDRCWQSAAFIS